MSVAGSLLWWLEPVFVDKMGVQRVLWALGIKTSTSDQGIVVIFEQNHQVECNYDHDHCNNPKHNGNGGPAAEAILDILPLDGSGWEGFLNIQPDVLELLLLLRSVLLGRFFAAVKFMNASFLTLHRPESDESLLNTLVLFRPSIFLSNLVLFKHTVFLDSIILGLGLSVDRDLL